MLPVATPPNAIVYGSHVVGIQKMAWAGLWLNLLAVVVVTGFVCLLLPRVWNLDLQDAAGLIP
jgi:sodium-dependent dicarboxylate transporter 2/3/5